MKKKRPDKNNRKKEGRRRFPVRGALSAVFAAAAIGSAAFNLSLLPFAGDNFQTAPQPPSTSQVLYAFNQQSQGEPWSRNEFIGRWETMLQRQQSLMQNPADAAAYRQYLSQFDALRDKSLMDQANAVNTTVNLQIKYTNDPNACTQDGCGEDYWKSGVESMQSMKGDCEDYAIQKYFILQYLGVPEDRMVIALVDAGKEGHIDHAVLLLNISGDTTKKSDYIILDGFDNEAIVDSAYSKYVFYEAMNQDGFWMSDKALKPAAQQAHPKTVAALAGGMPARGVKAGATKPKAA